MVHFDLSVEVFSIVVDWQLNNGKTDVTFGMVSCEYEGKVQLRMHDTVSVWLVAMIPLNRNVAAKRGEPSRDGETWVALVRNVNAFIYEAGDQAPATPFYVRVTGSATMSRCSRSTTSPRTRSTTRTSSSPSRSTSTSTS